MSFSSLRSYYPSFSSVDIAGMISHLQPKSKGWRFDFSGNGDSEGAFRYGQYRSEAQELRCAKQHLEQQLGRRVVAMVGHSKGATDVLLYASQWDDLPCVVNLAGRCDVQKGVLERLGPEVLEQLDRIGQVSVTQTRQAY
eukprot:gene4893-5138_t